MVSLFLLATCEGMAVYLLHCMQHPQQSTVYKVILSLPSQEVEPNTPLEHSADNAMIHLISAVTYTVSLMTDTSLTYTEHPTSYNG